MHRGDSNCGRDCVISRRKTGRMDLRRKARRHAPARPAKDSGELGRRACHRSAM